MLLKLSQEEIMLYVEQVLDLEEHFEILPNPDEDSDDKGWFEIEKDGTLSLNFLVAGK